MLVVLKKSLMLLMVIWLGLLLSGCNSQEPIKIGVAVGLTGKQADLGVSVRNGIQLAVDTVNADGGVNGRRIALMIEDDKGEPETARLVDDKLVKAGVAAIIGHGTSSQTAAVFEQMNQAQVVLLSPTTSSAQFSNQDDYFFRVQAASDMQGVALAQYAYQTLNLRQITVVYDVRNQAFSEAFLQSFGAKFEAFGGETLQIFPFTSGKTDLQTLADDVLATNPPALLLVSAAIDTAFMTQYINQREGTKPVLLSSGWAQTSELLTKGGRAIEGLSFSTPYNPNNPNPEFQKFLQRYEERFNRKPGFAATHGYEAVQLLVEALRQTGGNAEGLPEALKGIKNFPAVHGTLSLNEYGDVERDLYITVVEEGRFKVVETLSGNR